MGFDLANLFSVALGAILVNNFIFSQFLGSWACPRRSTPPPAWASP